MRTVLPGSRSYFRPAALQIRSRANLSDVLYIKASILYKGTPLSIVIVIPVCFANAEKTSLIEVLVSFVETFFSRVDGSKLGNAGLAIGAFGAKF